MRPLKLLLAASLLVPLMAGAGSGWLLRESALERAAKEARDTAQILREHTLRVMEAQEQVISRIDERLRGLSWDAIERSRPIHETLAALAQQSPHVDGIWLVAPEGRTVNSADFFPMPLSIVTDREYFKVLRERDVTHLGEMIVGRLKGNLNFNLSRRRATGTDDPPGTFDGVILVTSSLDYFAAFWGDLRASAPHVVALVRDDGKRLARFPALPGSGPDVPLDAARAAAASGAALTATSTADGVERIHGIARLNDYPAHLVFGLDRDGVLQPWRRQMILVTALALAAAAAMVSLTLRGMRNQRRERMATERWRRTAAALRAEMDLRTTAERDLEAKSRHVAELERLRAGIEAAHAQAEEANRDKTRFLAAASHDLRQPLQAMRTLSHLLAERLPPGPERDLAGQLQIAVRANAGLVNALLDISKLDAGLAKPRPIRFAVQDLLDELAVEFAPAAADKRLRLRVAPCAAQVETDRDLLGAIVRNLVSNAVRYTQSGGVLVGCRRAGGHLRIEVWDTGIGIPEAEQKSVFKEFHQLDNPERDREKGLGIGLSTVERLTRLLELDLSLRSVPGRGSVFAVGVPLAAEAAPAEMPAPAAVGGRVLVIEDDALQLAATEMLMRSWGYVVTGVSGLAAALAAAEAGLPDALVTDYRLRGGEDGLAAILALRDRTAHPIPALLVTGELMPREDLPPGVAVLGKPYHPEQLRAALGALGTQAVLPADEVAA